MSLDPSSASQDSRCTGMDRETRADNEMSGHNSPHHSSPETEAARQGSLQREAGKEGDVSSAETQETTRTASVAAVGWRWRQWQWWQLKAGCLQHVTCLYDSSRLVSSRLTRRDFARHTHIGIERREKKPVPVPQPRRWQRVKRCREIGSRSP